MALALPPEVLLLVSERLSACAFPLDPSSPGPLVDVALAAPPVVVSVVLLVALAPEFETVPVPVAFIGAFTVVAPTVAVLPWFEVLVILVGPPPAFAELVTDGVTVCVIAPVLPSPLPWLLELAPVVVDPPLAVLFASGDTVIEVLPVLLLLLASGETLMELPDTVPLPWAVGLLDAVDDPPEVLLVVTEVPVEVAFPLPPEPDVAVPAAGAPVVVPVVVVVAEVPPAANAGAVTRTRTRATVKSAVAVDARADRRNLINLVVSSGLIPAFPFYVFLLCNKTEWRMSAPVVTTTASPPSSALQMRFPTVGYRPRR